MQVVPALAVFASGSEMAFLEWDLRNVANVAIGTMMAFAMCCALLGVVRLRRHPRAADLPLAEVERTQRVPNDGLKGLKALALT